MSANGHRRSYAILMSHEREDYGVLAMMRSLDGTREVCREFGGYVRQAMQDVADYCDRHDLYVTCLSTPNTIFGDLQGRTAKQSLRGAQRIATPERILLTQVKRLDRLHPELR